MKMIKEVKRVGGRECVEDQEEGEAALRNWRFDRSKWRPAMGIARAANLGGPLAVRVSCSGEGCVVRVNLACEAALFI